MPNLYANLTQLKSMLGITGTEYDTDLLSNLEAVSRLLEGREGCNRKFYCQEETRYFDGFNSPLFVDDLLSITTLKADFNVDGTFEATLAAGTDYLLYPLNRYPKQSIKISPRSTTYVDFNNGVKKGVEIAGVWGCAESATPYHASGAVVNSGNMSISAATHALATGKGALFAVGQTIRIGSEQLYISTISGDTLTFLFNPTRGQNGTTAAAHTAADVIYIYDYPEPIIRATLIQAKTYWKKKDADNSGVISSPMGGGALTIPQGLDPDVRTIIKSYRKFVSLY